MFGKITLAFVAVLSLASASSAQTTNANTARRQRTSTTTTTTQTTTNSTPTTATTQQETTTTTTTPASRTRRSTTQARTGETAASRAVRDAFDTLINGIRRADTNEVMSVYWNSPQLLLFNNNGTVTKSWEQVRSNRQSLYAKVRDVKLDISDDRVRMLGPGAALVTARWKQTQTYEGRTESSSGRLTVVFQNIGGQWKAVHAHTSPDRPDPSLLPPSERNAEPPAAATAPPVRP